MVLIQPIAVKGTLDSDEGRRKVTFSETYRYGRRTLRGDDFEYERSSKHASPETSPELKIAIEEGPGAGSLHQRTVGGIYHRIMVSRNGKCG